MRKKTEKPVVVVVAGVVRVQVARVDSLKQP